MTASLLSNGLQYPDGDIQTTSPGVRSVQNLFVNPYGTVSGGDYGNRTVNITISSVNITKCILFYPGWLQYYDNGYTSFLFFTAKLTSATNLQLSQTYYYNSQRSVRIQIIEFI
jgi:hypothetical protein